MLEISNLKTYYTTFRGDVKAVDDVTFQLQKGEAFALAGESGCGKTTLALSIMRLLPWNARIVDGSVLFDGTEILKLSESSFRREYRWKRMSIIFQGAMNSLNPVHRVGDQIAEAIVAHESIGKKEALGQARKLLDLVGVDPERAVSYPHELSGGMRQRVMIAMALACNPDFVIADEPVTALDVLVQAQVLELIKRLQKGLALSMMLITHDLSVIAEICKSAAIMYAGKVVEYADIVSIFKKPAHPYTQGLVHAFPSIRGEKKDLISIPGSPPNLLSPPPGCRFHVRCPFVMDKCKEREHRIVEVGKGHYAACHMID